MKEKAALKNPDEFYFNMVRTKQAPPPSRPAAPACPHAVPTTTSRMPRRVTYGLRADESACGMRHADTSRVTCHMPRRRRVTC
eukprot:scaffold44595_cov69-Phaeocystis_antarctica.AAC.2